MLRFIVFSLLATLSSAAPSINEILSGLKDVDVYPVQPTGSMEPTINGNSLLLVRPIRFADLRKGDVIVFRAPKDGYLVVHRIWGISSGGSVLITRGDNNKSNDPWFVTEKLVVGLVVGVIRNDGF